MPYTFELEKELWQKNPISYGEQFFVSYAVNGPIVNPSCGGRAGLPVDYPIPGPVSEPSPLNNRYQYVPIVSTIGIL